MTSNIRDRISVWGTVAAAALLAVAVVGTRAAAQDDVEAQKNQIVRTALEKLGRSTDNPPLFEAAKNAEALTDIRIGRSDTETLVEIITTGEPVYRHFVLEAENKLVVDFYNTVNLRHNESFAAPESAVVEQVRTSLYQLDPQFVSRVVVDLNRLVQMKVDRANGNIVVHVPDSGVLMEEEARDAPAESAVVARLEQALRAQQARVAEAEAQLKQEADRRAEAERELNAVLGAKAGEIEAAIEAERNALAEARDALEAQTAQRAAAEAELKTKLADAEAELAATIDAQKKAIADAEARLREEESKRVETEEQFTETRQDLEQQRSALAKLEADLESARAERGRIEQELTDKLAAKEAETQAQIEERQKALDDMAAKLADERAAKAALAASLQEEISARAAGSEQQLAEQKTALAELKKELDSARAQIEAAQEKLVLEEATKQEFEAKLAERESKLKATLDEQAEALEDANAKLAKEAETRTAVEDMYKQQLAQARSAAEQRTTRLEQTVKDLQKQLADRQSSGTEAEQQLRLQLAEREQETTATIAALQKKVEEIEQAAAAEQIQLSEQMEAQKAAAIEQVQQELAAARQQLAARDQDAQARMAELAAQVAEKERRVAELEAMAAELAAAPPVAAAPRALDEQTITVTFRETELTTVLDILSRAANINILAGKDVTGTVTARLNKVPLLQALDSILRDNGYGYVIEDGIYRVVSLENPQGESMVTDYIRLSNADATDVAATLKELTSPSGSVVANKSANAVVIVDLKENIDRLREITEHIDSSLEGVSFGPGEAGMVTRSFTLTMADALEVQDTIKGLMSPKGAVVANQTANLLIVTDSAERVDEIEKFIDELDVGSPVVDVESGIFKLSYAPATEVAKILEGIVTKEVGSVIADIRSNQIIVTDTPSNFALIDSLIPELDRRVSQVYIEVMMVDAVLNDDAQYGLKWLADAIFRESRDLQSLTFGADPVGLSDVPPPSLDAGAIAFGIIGSDVNIHAVIAAEVRDRDAHIFANPNILVLNNQTAQIEMVQEIPFQEMTQTTQGPPVSSTEFKDIGVTLLVKPQITHDQSIILDLSPEESSISGYSATAIPIEDSRRARTTLLIDDGATVYIGGLRSISKSLDVSKVPVLGDIPYMGTLFRGTQIADHRTELMVFVTVHILEEGLPGLTPDEQRKFDQMDLLPEVPDTTRDLLHDMADPTGIREPLWRWRSKVNLPRTK